MTEIICRPEFADRLPLSSDFERLAKMAVSAADLADCARTLLEEDVSARNEGLKLRGEIGKMTEFLTHEVFRQRGHFLQHFMWDGNGVHTWFAVKGRFIGLTALDTKGDENVAYQRIPVPGVIEPERFVVCGTFAQDVETDLDHVPLSHLDTPAHIMRAAGAIK